MRRTVTMAGLLFLLLAGCGKAEAPIGQSTVASPYDGPMSAPADPGNEMRPVMERGGAAALALKCDWIPRQAGAGDYVDGGLEAVQDTAAEALADFLANEAWAHQLPRDGYRVEREDDDRVLLSFDVGEKTKIAMIAADKITDWNDDTGWGIESWAACDPYEWPADVTDDLGIGVWASAAGDRIPTAKVRSFQGAEHCDWQDITFLMLGPVRDGDQYVRDVHGELDELLRTTYDASVDLPDEATDTGMRRDGRQLWLGPRHEAAYLVSVDDPRDVERWPAAKERIGCA